MHFRRGLLLLSLVIAAVIVAPVATIVIKLLPLDYATWQHLSDTVLFTYISHSFLLSINVLVLATVIALSSAWLCSQCEFPGRPLLEWMLILPLSYPAYMIAYIYSGMLDYGGSLFTALSAVGLENPLPLRSLSGASILFAMVFYPYLYLLARAAWLNHSARLTEESRVLGATPWQSFLFVSLPAARPAIAVGMAIILMETLAEYGGVHYLGIPTFSVGIFRTWLGMDNLNGAIQLSLVLLLIVIFFFLIEKRSRIKARYYEIDPGHVRQRYHLRGYWRLLAWLVCFTPPLLDWVLTSNREWANYWNLVNNSLFLALASTLLIAAVALLLAYACRLNARQPWHQALLRASAYGYAVPGTVIAVGVLSLSVLLDYQLAAFSDYGLRVLSSAVACWPWCSPTRCAL